MLGIIAALSELTERMRAEQSLQEHEGRLDVLTRSLPDYLWGGKLRGGVLRDFYCTPVIERTTGYPASAFAWPGPEGGPPPLWAEMIHPEDRPRYRAAIEGLAPGAEAELEHRLICADGRVRWVRSRAAASVLDAQGELHVGCVVTDVTDRHLADALRQRLHDSFRRSAQEWRRTFDAVSSPLVVLGADGTVQRLNAAARALFSGGDPTSHPLHAAASTPPWSNALPLGYQVDSAQALDEALGLMTTGRYDLVISDLRLSGTQSEEGLLLADHVRRSTPQTRVVLLTAFATPELAERARGVGVDLVLPKPQPLLALAQHVSQLLSVAR